MILAAGVGVWLEGPPGLVTGLGEWEGPMRPDSDQFTVRLYPHPRLSLHPPPAPSAQAQTALACMSGLGPGLGLKSK